MIGCEAAEVPNERMAQHVFFGEEHNLIP